MLPSLKVTNIAPEKWWLKDYFRFGKANFQGLFLFQGEYIIIFMMSKFRTSSQWVFVLNQWHGGRPSTWWKRSKNCQTGPMQRRLPCAQCCWIVASSRSTMSMLLDCSFGCSLWDFVAGMLPYYCGIWVTCFTFSMAGSASTSFSTFY